jgi:hypothetical protein
MGIHDLAFKIIRNKSKKLTLLKVAGYFFMFAVCAKLIYFVEASHPAKENLLPVQGVVREVKIGGEGSSTYLKVESLAGTHRYSSFYGKDWPGMELIRAGDRINLLVEKNRLNKNELFSGKQYYIWELVHGDQMIIRYEYMRILVQGKDAIANRFINIWLTVGFAFLVAVYVRKSSQKNRAK